MTQERLYQYLRGESTADERQRILQWINASPANMQVYRTMRSVYDTMLCGETDLRLRKITPPRRHRHLLRNIAAPIFGVGLCVAVYFGLTSIEPPAPELVTLSPINSITVPVGQRTELTLADGTHVWLSSNSTIKLAADGTPRTVALTGEAYFDVVKDPEHPFIVNVGGRSISVYGTRFNVSTPEDSRNLEIQLYDGAVNVTDSIFHRTVSLSPGQQLIADNTNMNVSNFNPDGDEPLWIQGIYNFQNSSFTEILTQMSRVYNAKLVLERSWTDRQRCTGKFHEADGLQNLLESLDNIRPFSYQWDPDTRILRIK